MPVQLVLIPVLVTIFLIATVLPVPMVALGFVAASVCGCVGYASSDEGYGDTIAGSLPGSLLAVLVGGTHLSGIAKDDGAVDWLVHASVRASGGRLWASPIPRVPSRRRQVKRGR